MPNPNQKNKKKKSVRTPGGVSKKVIVKKKTSKHKCALCKEMLHGMPHGKRPFEVKKLKKTERRPENLLASMLCPVCRDIIYQEAVMLKYKLKTEKDIDLKNLKYVNMILKRIE
jgi:large subunit ribosomal protein L34e